MMTREQIRSALEATRVDMQVVLDCMDHGQAVVRNTYIAANGPTVAQLLERSLHRIAQLKCQVEG